MSLQAGDVAILYPDGVNEAQNPLGQLFGEERIYEIVESLPRDLCAREVADRLLGALAEFLEGAEPQDDVTLMVLRVLEPSPQPREIAGEPEAVAAK